MSLQNGSLRAAAETAEQFEALLDTEVTLIYIDSGYFAPGSFRALCGAAHAAGKACGLRFPHIFREDGADFFLRHKNEVFGAGFDAFLIRSLEELCFLRELKKETGMETDAELVTDHSLYVFNSFAAAVMEELLAEGGAAAAGTEALGADRGVRITLPLELNSRELAALCRMDRKVPHELLVYGRAPMMVSAQCIRKTLCGCDKRPVVMQLKDRKGALLPVKNNCTFCYNTILNAGPTVIYDREKELSEIGADSLRYEFTTETAKEVKEILSGKRIWRENEFTRGHFKRGVE
ncbi:MAG: hypothetical protein Q4C63_08330 [Eubacteriales bacterium]|nr:hypothetical protein [Eubacteriales bacterium]